METVNHECYVSLEVAKLLKEAGFDWECNYVMFDTEDNIAPLGELFNKGHLKMCGEHIFLAPTLEVAQRWLREVKNIDVYIFPTTNPKRECVYQEGMKIFGRSLWIPGQPSTAQYRTYEKAQEAGINKCLTILLEEKK